MGVLRVRFIASGGVQVGDLGLGGSGEGALAMLTVSVFLRVREYTYDHAHSRTTRACNSSNTPGLEGVGDVKALNFTCSTSVMPFFHKLSRRNAKTFFNGHNVQGLNDHVIASNLLCFHG